MRLTSNICSVWKVHVWLFVRADVGEILLECIPRTARVSVGQQSSVVVGVNCRSAIVLWLEQCAWVYSANKILWSRIPYFVFPPDEGNRSSFQNPVVWNTLRWMTMAKIPAKNSDSSVDIMTRLQAEQPETGFESWLGQNTFSPQISDYFWDPPRLLWNGYWGRFLRE